ncbi:hypothetical protein BKA65DRAFT_471959 [Rhexocercosporidium sp. MPI-PUGE-AT-0058]|nr:hypothetical protein BKA65DRAFT_471959 [Rhexocercosporidium sp. MPI-PUGE-AT-0058]
MSDIFQCTICGPKSFVYGTEAALQENMRRKHRYSGSSQTCDIEHLMTEYLFDSSQPSSSAQPSTDLDSSGLNQSYLDTATSSFESSVLGQSYASDPSYLSLATGLSSNYDDLFDSWQQTYSALPTNAYDSSGVDQSYSAQPTSTYESLGLSQSYTKHATAPLDASNFGQTHATEPSLVDDLSDSWQRASSVEPSSSLANTFDTSEPSQTYPSEPLMDDEE